ncbi:hypothetical protein AB4Z13_27320 [Rhizobium sp. YAF28]|uniref:hypothetical protein n=1 Tax=Rhizobium sp. YAF28 TaxID=3233081 RepID=UPI003F9EB45E
MSDLKIFISAGADDSAELTGDHRPCAYVAFRTDGNSESRFCGQGHLLDMNAAMAEGLLAALTDFFPIDPTSDFGLLPDIEIICPGPGFWKRVIQTCEAETSNPHRARGLDQHDCWKKLAVLAATLELAAPRKPSSPSERGILNRVTEQRKKLAKEAIGKVPRDASGISVSWREDMEPNR